MKFKFFKRISLVCVVAIISMISLSLVAQDESVGFSSLKKKLAALAGKGVGNAVVGVTIADVNTGQVIYSRNADSLLNPASNAKIVTAACALKVLGPEFRFDTSLHGKRDGVAIRGSLYIKGHADPTLSTEDLWEMSMKLRAAGIHRVEGGIVVDDTYFDSQNLPFAFDQQPNEDNKFRTPVGAVSLNHNALAIDIQPAASGMAKAKVVLDPPGYAILINDTLTVGKGAHNPKISSTTFENRTRVRVWGQIPLGARLTTYYRRIDNPSLFSGYGLKGVLERVGISVGGDVKMGTLPSGTPLLASHRSLPLSSVLWETGKMSNNFVTETILKTMGAEASKDAGTWEKAVGEVERVMAGWGIPAGSYVYRNGSGLFDADKISTSQLVKVLRSVYLNSEIRPEFLAQLATGGVDGTIASRYKRASAKRHVRAKTGTLSDVSALSGYVLDKGGQHPIAFSILVNKAPGYVSAARRYQEEIVTAIANFLNP